MKKLIFSMLAGMMALGATAQTGKFTVTGTYSGLGDTALVALVDAAGQNALSQEKRAITDDKIDLSFDLEDVARLYVLAMVNGQPSQETYFSIPAIPGENVVVSGGGDDFVLSGSQFYVDYNEALKCVSAPQQAANEFMMQCQQKLMMGTPEDEVRKEYEEKFPALEQAVADAVIAYVTAHPDQDASAALLAELGSDVDNINLAAALLSERARGSKAAKLYKSVIAAAEKERAEEARQEALEGSEAPDFTLNDINGEPLALSSLRGKWVVIDFWGSWCHWCIKGMPKMKEYYTKYEGKLEILGVDCNDTVEKWKAAVAKHELPWLHVYCDMENKENNPLALYGVRGFPTKVIVDPKGMIAKVIVGEDPAFYDFLDRVIR